MINIDAWYHGIYVRDAIASCFSKEANYPEKPIDFMTNKEKPQEIVENSVNNDAIRFSAWTKAFNQNFIQQHPESQ